MINCFSPNLPQEGMVDKLNKSSKLDTNKLIRHPIIIEDKSIQQMAPLRVRKSRQQTFRAIITILVFFLIYIAILFIADAVYWNFPVSIKSEFTIPSDNCGVFNKVYEEYKSVSNIKLNIENREQIEMSVPALTVGEVVTALQLSKDENYVLNYRYDDVVSEGMEITVNKIDISFMEINEYVPYEVRIVHVNTIPKGKKVVVQSGVDSYVANVYKQLFENGELAENYVVKSTLLKSGQPEIIYEGIGGTFKDESGMICNYSYYVDVIATAYGVDTGYGGDSKYTSTGKLAEIGVIAVDPNIIPLGSTVYVTGEYKTLGVCHAEDTGSSIVGKRIDIYLGSNLEEQLKFGRRDMRVYILE